MCLVKFKSAYIVRWWFLAITFFNVHIFLQGWFKMFEDVIFHVFLWFKMCDFKLSIHEWGHTVDGSEIRRLPVHMVVYPVIYQDFLHPKW